MSDKLATVRLLFVDDGEYHQQEVELPAAPIEEYDRLIDYLREDPDVLKRLHLDLSRLCSAEVASVEDG